MSSSIDQTLKTYISTMAQSRFQSVWQLLSPELQATLTDQNRQVIKNANAEGVNYLKNFAEKHAHAFVVGSPMIQSRHRVPLQNSHKEMVMVHARANKNTAGLTFWLSRFPAINSYWTVEELYVHPRKTKQNTYKNGKTLSGKTMTPRSKEHMHKQSDEPNQTNNLEASGDQNQEYSVAS